MPGVAMENARVCSRHANVWLVRVSSVVHVVPSLEPFTTHAVGSLPAVLDDVRVYVDARAVVPLSWYCTHGVAPVKVTRVSDVLSNNASALPAAAVAVPLPAPVTSMSGAGTCVPWVID